MLISASVNADIEEDFFTEKIPDGHCWVTYTIVTTDVNTGIQTSNTYTDYLGIYSSRFSCDLAGRGHVGAIVAMLQAAP